MCLVCTPIARRDGDAEMVDSLVSDEAPEARLQMQVRHCHKPWFGDYLALRQGPASRVHSPCCCRWCCPGPSQLQR